MNKTIRIVPIEPIETRYTGQWFKYFPKIIRHYLDAATRYNDDVMQYHPDVVIPTDVTPGAFLNFSGTSVYKSAQMKLIADDFANGTVKAGDIFIFTDAWNPNILQVKYLSELLHIPVKLMGLWHAGSYDPHDFLGRAAGHEAWAKSTEEALFYALDVNVFATQFHADLFVDNRVQGFDPRAKAEKILISGWPMDYLAKELEPFKTVTKEPIVVFPHRIAPEKQVEIFRDLGKSFPDYKFIVCQDQKLTKDEYHKLLASSVVTFSCSLQETLGISMMEGMLLGSMPLVPDRLSYSEMYEEYFKYPSEWTESWESYLKHKEELVESMKNILDYSMYLSEDEYDHFKDDTNVVYQNYFNCYEILRSI